jgi:hypothetical protein
LTVKRTILRRTRPARIGSALALAAAVTLAACGGDDDESVLDAQPDTTAPAATAAPASSTTTAAPARTEFDACELLSQEQADAVMGQSLQTGVPSGPPDDHSCTYTGPPEGSVAQIELFVGPGAKKFLDIDKDLDHEFTPVEGIGDEAEIEEGALFFRVGTTWAAIRIVTLDEWATYQPRVEALAREIAAEM